MAKRKVNYLNNKDMLKEIHKSKINFCDYDTPEDTMFDCIVDNLTDITHENLFIAQEAQAKRLSKEAHLAEVEIFDRGEMVQKTKPKLAAYKIEPADIPIADLVFRAMTFDHIPEDLERKKTHKTIADSHVKLHFVPFKHYRVSHEAKTDFTEVVADDGCKIYVKEVLRSHHYAGEFNLTHGAITRRLAEMYLLMVKKYGERSNWRGYTYIDEMKGQALLQLSQMGLQFNEAKSDNPFSYFTASVKNSFTRILNLEKRNQNIRDDLLEAAGQAPSHTRQNAHEAEIRRNWEESYRRNNEQL
jgi:hypothetical protein